MHHRPIFIVDDKARITAQAFCPKPLLKPPNISGKTGAPFSQHSRHIDRKLYKMRELRGAGIVTVKYVPTDDNTADLFTKVLTRQPFEKHRRRVMNLTDK